MLAVVYSIYYTCCFVYLCDMVMLHLISTYVKLFQVTFLVVAIQLFLTSPLTSPSDKKVLV